MTTEIFVAEYNEADPRLTAVQCEDRGDYWQVADSPAPRRILGQEEIYIPAGRRLTKVGECGRVEIGGGGWSRVAWRIAESEAAGRAALWLQSREYQALLRHRLIEAAEQSDALVPALAGPPYEALADALAVLGRAVGPAPAQVQIALATLAEWVTEAYTENDD